MSVDAEQIGERVTNRLRRILDGCLECRLFSGNSIISGIDGRLGIIHRLLGIGDLLRGGVPGERRLSVECRLEVRLEPGKSRLRIRRCLASSAVSDRRPNR